MQSAFALVDAAIAHFGRIDCLVNNSGITLNQPFLETKPEWFDLLFNVNLKSQYFMTQRVSQHMIDRGVGGAICNITSIHGLSGAPEHSLYAATKGAIIAFTRTVAIELAHKGIRVNAIAPGWVTVENYRKAIPDFDADAAEKIAFDKVPLGRSGHPDEIAKLATFLCSDAAAYIIGQTIVADGGTTSLMSLISDFRTRSNAKFGTGYVPGI